jgi:hypothetical protein
MKLQLDGKAMTAVLDAARGTGLLEAAVSDKPWSGFSQADYSPVQWRRACLIHKAAGSDNKADHSLPVREPSGAVNRNGVHAAAARLGQVNAPADQKATAARALVRLYGAMNEDPPAAVKSMAGASTEAQHLGSTTFTEQTTLAEATRGAPTGKRMQVRLINSGWGSSGYYSPKVLAEAAGRQVFPAGLHMYLDHPSATEQHDRPERSVRDLAAVLATPATYTDGALYAEAHVFPPYRQVLAEMADHIGVSIRAVGQAESGEADGRTGPIITSLDEARSADFVTHAGRGGQIVALLESARTDLGEAGRNVGAWLESRLHCEFTELTDGLYGQGYLTRDERITLSSAIGDALDGFVKRVEADAPQLYQRDLYTEPPDDDSGETDTAAAVESTTTPSTTHGRSGMSGTDTTGTPAPEGGGAPIPTSPELAEAQNRATDLERALAEARGQVQQLSDNAVRADRAERALTEARAETARLRAAEVARTATMRALAESGLPEATWPRVTTVVLGHEGRAVPLTETGAADTDKLDAAITAAVDSEKSYIAALAEAAGTGIPRGLGTAPADGELTEAEFESRLAAQFGSLGLNESAAKIAAKGR